MDLEHAALPVKAVLPKLSETFRTHRAAVLVAPPGAGKSTWVPLFLLDEGLVGEGRLVLLEPRRMAARAVAERMAAMRNESCGDTVGWQIRFEKRMSARTRVLVMTEGILTRRLISDPLLEDISFVVLDEFHERSVHSDLALMFLKELLEARDDLRLLVMSATLDAARVSVYLNDCPIIESRGRTFPLTVSFASRADERALDIRAAEATTEALRTAPHGGDVLVFLPGEPEIRRAQAKLDGAHLEGSPEVLPLFGALPQTEQQRVLQPSDRRRVILATNIAETSLTIPGVTCVVDSGLRKRSRFDPAVGLDRLETAFISRASADQRAGRAGRIAPGQVYRLWTAHEHKGRQASDMPEIRLVDAAPVLLQLFAFRPGDPRDADWLDPPDKDLLEAGMRLLHRLGAMDIGACSLTDKGKRLAALPVHPRLGAILLRAEALQDIPLGATVAALASERDILTRSALEQLPPSVATDFEYRVSVLLDQVASGSNRRAASELHPGALRAVRQSRDALLKTMGEPRAVEPATVSVGRLLLAGFPDRVSALRSGSRTEAKLVGGKGARFPADVAGDGRLFVISDADAGPRRMSGASRVRAAVTICAADLEAEYPALISSRTRAVFNPKTETVAAWEETLFDDLVIAEKPATPDPVACAEALAEAARAQFPSTFSPSPEATDLFHRIRFASRVFPELPLADVSEAGLTALLPELCFGLRSLAEVRKIDWRAAIIDRMDYMAKTRLDVVAPERLKVPSGSNTRISYEDADKPDGAPHIACRIQELFGLLETPRVADGRVPLVIHLLAPNMRPCQVTRDLKSFWQTTYPEVRKELKGRYPKHYWPDDPFTAPPTARVRPRPTS